MSGNNDPNAADATLPHVTNGAAMAARRSSIAALANGTWSPRDGADALLAQHGVGPVSNLQIRLEKAHLGDYYRMYGHKNLFRDLPVLTDELTFTDTMNGRRCTLCDGPTEGGVDRVFNWLSYLAGTFYSACGTCNEIRGPALLSWLIEKAMAVKENWYEDLNNLGRLSPDDQKFVGESPIFLLGLTEDNWRTGFTDEQVQRIEAAHASIGRGNDGETRISLYRYATIVSGKCYCCACDLLPLVRESYYRLDRYDPDGDYTIENAFGCCGGLGDNRGCNHLMGRNHPKMFVMKMICIASNRALTENVDRIRELENQDGGWMEREDRQFVMIAANKLLLKDLYGGSLSMSRAIGTRSQRDCEEALQNAKATADAAQTYRRLLPNNRVIEFALTIYTSGIGANEMGHAIWQQPDFDSLVQVLNNHHLYESIDPDTSRLSFSIDNVRSIRLKLSEEHNIEKLVYHLNDILRSTGRGRDLPLIMVDGRVSVDEDYQMRILSQMNPTQHDLLFDSLEVGYGPWDYESGHDHCRDNDSLFPLSYKNYKTTVTDRMARIRRLDPIYYERLRDMCIFVGCGRDTCDYLFPCGHSSLATAPGKCCRCDYRAKNGRQMVIVPKPPICRQHYPKQNFFHRDVDGDVPRNVCTCPAQN